MKIARKAVATAKLALLKRKKRKMLQEQIAKIRKQIQDAKAAEHFSMGFVYAMRSDIAKTKAWQKRKEMFWGKTL